MRETSNTSPLAGTVSNPFSKSMRNGEMEVKEEYRGKIKYLYGREPEEKPGSDWVVRIAVTEEAGQRRH
jgi:hypothetical protein